MSGNETQPILVTGAHRTGTTWVGKTLSLERGLTYISEPLHFRHSVGVFRVQVPGWYTYICKENQDQYQQAFEDLLDFRYHFKPALKELHSIKDAGKLIRDSLTFLTARIANSSPLIKDPFAVFSVPWLLKRFNVRAVVLVRHPLSFVSSLKRLGWSFDFTHLLDQPLLMRDHLEPFRQAMESSQYSPEDVIGQGIMLWRMIYSTVYSYLMEYPGIILIRHEDLSLDPVGRFGELFERLDLSYPEEVQAVIRKTTRPANPDQLEKGKEHAIHLDSRANLQNFRQRLGAREIDRIVSGCQKELGYFYEPEEWKQW